MLPAPVFAADSNAKQTLELVPQTVSVSPDVDLPNNDELFALYVDQVLYGYEMATFGTLAGDKLKESNSKHWNVYDNLKKQIEAIAESGGSTQFTVPYEDTFTVEIESDTAPSGSMLPADVYAAFDQKMETYLLGISDPVLDALLADCPFDLYWYDKTQGAGIRIEGSQASWEYDTTGEVSNYVFTVPNTSLTFSFTVAGAYQATQTETDGTTTKLPYKVKETNLETVQENVTKALNRAAGLSDYEKLVKFKEYICEAVTYKETATAPDTAYGDPWQLIYVFDGDEKTNVVCEGYAKAFQYLCDQSGIDCISPTGDLGYLVNKDDQTIEETGPHMWNVVYLDEAYYLVDMTNCDDDSEGGTATGDTKLFLKGAVPETVDYTDSNDQKYTQKYTFNGNTANPTYYYCDNLGIASSDYVVTYPVNFGEYEHGSVTATFEKHNHAWSYKAEGATITATCNGAPGKCSLSDQKFTLAGPTSENLTYNGQAKVATVTGSVEGVTTPTITYAAKTGSALTGEEAINAGDYTASIKLGGVSAVLSFEITAKAIAENDVKLAQESVTYTGEAQQPTVTIDGLTFDKDYTVTYKRGDEATTDFTNAGTITVTVTGQGNYYTENAIELTFTINKATQAAPTGLTVTNETVKGKNNGSISGLNDKMEYATRKNGTYTAITDTKLENLAAGIYYVRFKADDNHNVGAVAEVIIKAGAAISVTIEVKASGDQNYTENVTIALMRGSKTIDTKTTQNGSVQFENMGVGVYNLVATYADGTKTELVTVDETKTITLTLPDTGVKSELNVKDNSTTPAVMVGGLDKEAAQVKTETGDASTPLNAVIEYLDINIEKNIDGTKTAITETTNVIEIVIPFNFAGKTDGSIKIIRYHGEGDAAMADIFEQTDTKVDKTFSIDKTNGYIHIFTQKFATYAVSYTTEYNITFDVNGGDTEIEDSVKTNANGTVTLPEEPSRTDYSFKGWYTAATGGTQITAETVFTGDTTVYAQLSSCVLLWEFL